MNIRHTVGQWALDPLFLHGRMSFISGPRQIGKTTLTQNFLSRLSQSGHYHNWDSLQTRRRFALDPQFFIQGLIRPLPIKDNLPLEKRQVVVMDEIHKYPKWKNILKGYFDDWKDLVQFIVTGSARLDFFRQSGDSLVGRYFLHRMYPLHPNDLTGQVINRETAWHPKSNELEFDTPDTEFLEAFQYLYHLSGFPEPVSVGTIEFYNRWKNNHISLITTEDVRDLSRISQTQKLQTLFFLLPQRIGAPVSLNRLKSILNCAHGTVQNWLDILTKVYLIFSVPPFTPKLARAVRKERKFYVFDWGLIPNENNGEGKRLENFVAVQLTRAVSAWHEWGKGDYQLFFVRTKDGREVDFLICEQSTPLVLVECKSNDKNLSPHLTYFKERLEVPLAIQVIQETGYIKQLGQGVFILGIDRFLHLLP